jgi:2-polyprenyl-6-hydroxyphenyl methylase/3-demethylubiquinone-9 3-methyltransferase
MFNLKELSIAVAIFSVSIAIWCIVFGTFHDRSTGTRIYIKNDLSLYHTAEWWSERSSLFILRRMNEVRVPYFMSKFPNKSLDKDMPLDIDIDIDIEIVDVGCGGGFVLEDLAKAGFRNLTGFDISEPSLEKARKHAGESGFVSIKYSVGSAYDIPVASDSLDVVIISDVLEHLEDKKLALGEAFRVLRPGGVLVFDTIARTLWSWLSTYLAAQEILGLIEPGVHDWDMFIQPHELGAMLASQGFLTNVSQWRGIDSKWSLSKAFVNWNKFDFIESFYEAKDDLTASYMGCAYKPYTTNKIIE